MEHINNNCYGEYSKQRKSLHLLADYTDSGRWGGGLWVEVDEKQKLACFCPPRSKLYYDPSLLPTTQDWEQRQEEDNLLIERILLLVRNVLHVPADPDEEKVFM